MLYEKYVSLCSCHAVVIVSHATAVMACMVNMLTGEFAVLRYVTSKVAVMTAAAGLCGRDASVYCAQYALQRQ